ncbi:MAG: SRPBCC family protein [bacterium]
MGLIKLQVKSKAPVEVVYEIAHQPINFVDVMPNIKRIRQLEENNDHTYSKTEWVLDVPLPKILGEVSWIKDAHWNDNKRLCDISLNPDSKGIVKRIKGLWKFIPCQDGTDMSMSMDLTVRHILIGANTTNIIDMLFRKNMENLMKAICAEAEKHS